MARLTGPLTTQNSIKLEGDDDDIGIEIVGKKFVVVVSGDGMVSVEDVLDNWSKHVWVEVDLNKVYKKARKKKKDEQASNFAWPGLED